MYKLLVVDDETLIREGITEAIPWNDHGITVVGCASDGDEALELYRAHKPDIVITDIQMDNLGGLDLAEAIKSDDPGVKVIIISGYDNFEYAQRALEVHTFSYILKPILPDELVSIVLSCVREIEEEHRITEKIEAFDTIVHKERDRLIAELLHNVLDGMVGDSAEFAMRASFLKLDFVKQPCTCIIFSAEEYRKILREEDPRALYQALLGMHTIIRETLDDFRRSAVVVRSTGNIAAVVEGAATTKGNIENGIETILKRIQAAVRKHLGVTLTVAVGGTVQEMYHLRRSYLEALRCLEYRIAVGQDAIITHHDIEAMEGFAHVYPIEEEGNVLRSLSEENVEGLRDALYEFFHEVKNQCPTISELDAAGGCLISSIFRFLSERGCDIPNSRAVGEIDTQRVFSQFESLEVAVDRLHGMIAKLLEEGIERRTQGVRRVICRVQEYILKNYTRADLSLLMVAEHVNLSLSYLSKLFKRETGTSYLEYIISLRIEEAKRLLTTTNKRIADVGKAVGYNNPQYFCTLFKKTTGESPVDFRERFT